MLIMRVFFMTAVLLFAYVDKALADTVAVAEKSVKACDPVVTVRANNQSRFEVLKGLAEVHDFSINLPEVDKEKITLERTGKLSRVVEAITRDANVVLRYERIDGCDALVAVSIVNDGDWDNTPAAPVGRVPGSSPAGLKDMRQSPRAPRQSDTVRRNLADLTPRPVAQEMLEEQITEEDLEQRQLREEARIAENERMEERRRERAEAMGVEYDPRENINETIQGGENLNAQYRAGRSNWRGNLGGDEAEADGLGIEDMEPYVKEVLAGERMPDTGNMNAKERVEYMRARNRIRSEGSN